MKKQELIDWLEWLSDDEECGEEHMLPHWVKFSIQEKIKKLKGIRTS